METNSWKGMTNVDRINILNNKIDKIGDLTITSESSVKSLVIQGNHLLEVPLNSALSVSLES